MQSPMNNASDREVAVFNAVLQLPAGQRAACLDRECAGDVALRQKIEALLRVHDEVGTFLESPTQGAGLSMMKLGLSWKARRREPGRPPPRHMVRTRR